MKFNRFLRTIKTTPTHSSGLTGQDGSIRSSANGSQSFAQRQQLEGNRQHVRRYTDGAIVHGYRAQAYKNRGINQSIQNEQTAGKIDIVKPSRQSFNSSPVNMPAGSLPIKQSHTFREPPSRPGPF